MGWKGTCKLNTPPPNWRPLLNFNQLSRHVHAISDQGCVFVTKLFWEPSYFFIGISRSCWTFFSFEDFETFSSRAEEWQILKLLSYSDFTWGNLYKKSCLRFQQRQPRFLIGSLQPQCHLAPQAKIGRTHLVQLKQHETPLGKQKQRNKIILKANNPFFTRFNCVVCSPLRCFWTCDRLGFIPHNQGGGGHAWYTWLYLYSNLQKLWRKSVKTACSSPDMVLIGPDSGIQEMFACGMRDPGLSNPAYSWRKPEFH